MLNENDVETVCCLYHQKKEFISVPYEPKNADYLKRIPGSATYDEIKEWVQKHYQSNGEQITLITENFDDSIREILD